MGWEENGSFLRMTTFVVEANNWEQGTKDAIVEGVAFARIASVFALPMANEHAHLREKARRTRVGQHPLPFKILDFDKVRDIEA
jgi:hypothetical protein